MGEDFVKEFIMFSYDVPLSKQFVYRGYATFAERFRRVLKTQPGFIGVIKPVFPSSLTLRQSKRISNVIKT
jgi:hypothetical protein